MTPANTTDEIPPHARTDYGIIIPDRQRVLLLAMRQALLIGLGALEDYLGLERSVIPKHKRANN